MSFRSRKDHTDEKTLTLLAILATVLGATTGSATDKPNIVYILADNWGWGDISIQGSTVPTPRIDSFAAEVMRFTNFNVQNQCTPTRSAIHTGRLPIRSGTQKAAAPGEPDGLSPWEYTIAELLSDAGYATALYGKWHVGSKVGRLPSDQGYDEWFGINEGYVHAWVMGPVTTILTDLAKSMPEYPKIKPGQDFNGYR